MAASKPGLFGLSREEKVEDAPLYASTSPQPGSQQVHVDENKVSADDGGYDPEMFVDQRKAREFTCPFCQLIMKEPTDIGCGNEHSFCKSCVHSIYDKIEKTKSLGGSTHVQGFYGGVPRRVPNECPKCKNELHKEDIEEDDERHGEILMLDVKCLKCNKWQGKLANYKKHLKKECNKPVINNAVGSVIRSLGNLALGGDSFRIFVRTLEGRDIAFDNILGTDTVASLQQKIQDKEGIPVAQQRLMYRGRTLKPEDKLKDYKVREQSTLNLIRRLKGGV